MEAKRSSIKYFYRERMRKSDMALSQNCKATLAFIISHSYPLKVDDLGVVCCAKGELQSNTG
jgi:hypothetical protein